MPRVSRVQAERNREAITATASRLFRERGLKGVSVGELMNAVGLTHGGFYGHFESKEALAAEACARAFEDAQTMWQNAVATHPDSRGALQTIIEHYLSIAGRDERGGSCPVLSFSADMAHEDPESPLRSTYISGFEGLIKTLTEMLEEPRQADSEAVRRRSALIHYSLLVGAISLARATNGSPLSDEILDAARERFEQMTASQAAA